MPELEFLFQSYHVATTGDGGNDTSVELDEVGDLAGSEVNLDSVVDLDSRVGVADPGSVQYNAHDMAEA